jgi:uncharacterized protein
MNTKDDNKMDNRTDGWANVLTGLGMKARDKKTRATYLLDANIDKRELADIYRKDGFARKLIDRPVYDMLREGFEIKNDVDQAVVEYLKDLKWKHHVSRTLKWDRLYGGALLIVGAQDGQTLDTPLNRRTLRSIEFMRVVDAYGYDREKNVETDPESRRYGLPNTYVVNAGDPSKEYEVHYTRAFEYSGLPIPPGSSDLDRGKKAGGDSVLQGSYEALRALGVTYSNVESILDDFVTTTLTIKGLQGMIASGNEGRVLTRMHIMDMAKSIINTVLLDENEKYTKETSSVTGLAELIDRAAERLGAVSNIPIRILMGKQLGGLNNDGSAETRDWYDYVSALQEDYLQPCLEWLVDLSMACREGPTRGKEIDGWRIVFNPLWQLSDKEVAEIHNIQAEADTKYIDTGVLQPEEIAMSRFGQDEYSLDTVLLAERVYPGEGGENGAQGQEENE